jgi:pyrrolidone-carboxylate peptidase
LPQRDADTGSDTGCTEDCDGGGDSDAAAAVDADGPVEADATVDTGAKADAGARDSDTPDIETPPEPRPVIMLTGYWYPTGVMLAQFSQNSDLNPGGWRGENWEGRGYDVVSFFPKQELVRYTGDFEVDYQDTRADFDRIVGEVDPIAIMAHGRGDGPWEIEVNARNLSSWGNDYNSPRQPTPSPPDDTVAMGTTRHSTLPNEDIAAAINALNLSDIPPPCGAWIDEDGNPGRFLCEFMAYLVMWHQDRCATTGACNCRMAGFTHVGGSVSVESGKLATETALRVLIRALDEQRR